MTNPYDASTGGFPELHRLKPLCRRCGETCDCCKDELARLKGELRIKTAYVDRAPFCGDCRDKVAGLPCLRCENQRLKAELAEANADADLLAKYVDWRNGDGHMSADDRIKAHNTAAARVKGCA